MRIDLLRPALIVAGPLLLLASCGDEPLLPPLDLGLYALETVDGQALPAPHPCSGRVQVVEGRIGLAAQERAVHSLRYARTDREEEITYSGTGTYELKEGELILTLAGTWSTQDGAHEHQMLLGIESGVLRQSGVGAECDANSTMLYRLRAP